MLEQMKQESNYTRTENGALTYASTMDNCLDLFSTIGAMRHVDEQTIIQRFQRAYSENRELAMKCLFFARDIRGGIGERRVFRTIMVWLAYYHPESVLANLELVAEYGRYDDLLELLATPCKKGVLEVIAKQLSKDVACLDSSDIDNISLLGKWLPSINASNKETIQRAMIISKYLKISKADYRKLLSRLRAALKIIENNLREKDYSFDYSKQPSKAMLKYRQAFMNHDAVRYQEFLQAVCEGREMLHTGTLTPYDVIEPILGKGWGCVGFNDQQRKSLDTTWNALEDFTDDSNALVVVDGSGSMYGFHNPSPAAVAQSLAIYFAEHNKGAFRNHFITFSEKPRLIAIKGQDIVDKVEYCMSFSEVANTNLANVFRLILNTAVKHKLPQRELPDTLYIISDMEFDECAEGAETTNFQFAKRLFSGAGYSLPNVVFWNVAARHGQVPVTKNEQGVALVSGCSPQIFSMIKDKKLEPLRFMLEVLQGDRYAEIKA